MMGFFHSLFVPDNKRNIPLTIWDLELLRQSVRSTLYPTATESRNARIASTLAGDVLPNDS